jgi:hypothetical protein
VNKIKVLCIALVETVQQQYRDIVIAEDNADWVTGKRGGFESQVL